MDLLQFIIIAAEIIIAVFAYIIISSIHDKKGKARDLEAIEEDEDFITTFVKKKEADLIKAGSPVTVRTYIRIMVAAPM